MFLAISAGFSAPFEPARLLGGITAKVIKALLTGAVPSSITSQSTTLVLLPVVTRGVRPDFSMLDGLEKIDFHFDRDDAGPTRRGQEGREFLQPYRPALPRPAVEPT